MESSQLFPALHPENLNQLRSALRFPAFRKDGVWFHGDGNMYPDKKNSDDRISFHNQHPVNNGAGFRAHFDYTDAVPNTLVEMEKVLIQSMQDEAKLDTLKEKQKTSSNPNAFPIIDEAADKAAADAKAIADKAAADAATAAKNVADKAAADAKAVADKAAADAKAAADKAAKEDKK